MTQTESNKTDVAFEMGEGFAAGELTGTVQLGKFEAYYEQLFAEVIEDGIITAQERARLDKAADMLGLERERLRRIERALQAAYEARNQVRIHELSQVDEDDAPRASLVPLEPATDQRTLALERRIKFLETRVAELEYELAEARAHVPVEIDLSEFSEAPKPVADDDPVELQRRLRHDPRDIDALSALYRVWTRRGDLERRWGVAHVLRYLGQADDEQRAFHDSHHSTALIRPTSSVSNDAWRKLLFHPEQEILPGDILAVVASPVLLGRVSALRRDKLLPELAPERRQDPEKSTLQAVRCFSWAAAILGMTAPALYVDPGQPSTADMIPNLPPVSRLGKRALSGRNATELAFLAGRHLAYYRQELFVRALLPSIADLEDVLLAALSVGNPGLPLTAQVKQRVQPIARSIEPILEPQLVDHLRGYFLRFVEEGGRTNLQRWASAVDRTAARSGLLLCNDLKGAHDMLAIDSPAFVQEWMDDLLAFVISDRYSSLRKQIGIAIASN